ncbi:alkaline phosphatase family protein [Altererythrobacter sp. FM1]|uniref:alkaline phosphatase family protein n=1 Tax=Tsuneonella flava TaxID=2055955 RepID=UPI000C80DE95|nr:alkaline phosphatase family protein [Tsuneonella flava]ROT95656.1 alkaline phosphatase family protein [Altererythrobacter sp. FM1]
MKTTRKLALSVAVSLGVLAASPGLGEETTPPATPEDNDPPKLVLAISVDQFSADLFAQYRQTYTGGLKRLANAIVFPSGYQSHAATETCPGHSTIMTGSNPARTGIVANDWVDQSAARADKIIYCAEDEREAGTDHRNYVESAVHLLVPTLGERLKAISPASRNVAVSGKDRAALMMGGNNVDAIYFWKKGRFVTLKGRTVEPGVERINAELAPVFAAPDPDGLSVPESCRHLNQAIPVKDGGTVGTYHFNRPGAVDGAFRASPALDAWTVRVAEQVIDDMKLGQGKVPDVLSLGLSATDYIGHSFGNEGVEMCIQQASLDQTLEGLFSFLDAKGIDYMVMLTADHGGHDLPERVAMQAYPSATRIDDKLTADDIGAAIAADLGLSDGVKPLLARGPIGDFYLNRDLSGEMRDKVRAAAITRLKEYPQVAAVFDARELAQVPLPTGPVEEWTLEERARASFYAPRSGDIIVLLRKAVTPIAHPGPGYVATHGSPYDYDRRVPILFWRKGLSPFEQPLSVRTVDIEPTLAPFVGVTIPQGDIDGRCLDLDAGAASTCGLEPVTN